MNHTELYIGGGRHTKFPFQHGAANVSAVTCIGDAGAGPDPRSGAGPGVGLAAGSEVGKLGLTRADGACAPER